MTKDLIYIAIDAIQSGKVQVPSRKLKRWHKVALKALDITLTVCYVGGIAYGLIYFILWLLKR